MQNVSDLLIADDDFTSVRLWLEQALARGTADGLIFELELAFGSIHKRAGRAKITRSQGDLLRKLLEVCRRRCHSHLLPRCSHEDIWAGFAAANTIVDAWACPGPWHRASPDSAARMAVARFHGVLRTLRRAHEQNAVAFAPPPRQRQIIPFPTPFQEPAR